MTELSNAAALGSFDQTIEFELLRAPTRNEDRLFGYLLNGFWRFCVA